MARKAVDVPKLQRLANRLRRAGAAPAPNEPTDPTDEMIVSLLLEGTSEARAAAAMRRLKRNFVDYNEVRVTRMTEIEDAIRPLPDAQRKSQLISQVLGAVFDRFHRTSLEPVTEMTKRDARKLLEDVAGPVAAARVLLLSLASHAVPADDGVRRVLAQEGVTEPEIEPDRLQAALERHVKSDQAYVFYRRLRDLAEAGPTKKKTARKKRPAGAKTVSRPKRTAKKKAAGKPAKKKSPPKRKTARKKVARKRSR